jgi:hypothetical protein
MMLKRCKLLLLVLISVAMLSSEAFAGDEDEGGAKRNGKIRVRNEFGFVVGVIVDADPADLEEAAKDDDPGQAFEDLGGVILNAGDTAVFTGLKAGEHEVFAVDVDDFLNTATLSVDLDKGQTRTVRVVDDDGDISLE